MTHDYTVAPGEDITLSFSNIGDGHVDQVSFVVEIPEPSTFALAAFGLLGVIGFTRRKR